MNGPLSDFGADLPHAKGPRWGGTPPVNSDSKLVATAEYVDRAVANAFAGTFSGTVVLAKITGGGASGSLTVVNGLITAYTAPT